MTAEELKTCFDCIGQFENLKELKIKFSVIMTKGPIDNCLSLIGQKCNKLLKLDLDIHYWVHMSDKFFDIFSEFKCIKELKLRFTLDTVLSGSVECFKHCKQLKHLDIDFDKINVDFFANIDTFLHKLQTLGIVTDIYNLNLPKLLIESFCSMERLQIVTFKTNSCDWFVHDTWYFGKYLSEVMFSDNGLNVKHINDNCGFLRLEFME